MSTTTTTTRPALNLDIMMMVFEYLDLETIRTLDTMPVRGNLPNLPQPHPFPPNSYH